MTEYPSQHPRPVDAATYTHGHHASVLASHRWRTIANSAAYLEPRLVAGRSLLDVGCGPGTITAEFALRLAPGRVVGLDAAASAITAAEAHAVEVGADVTFVRGDAFSLPFDDGSFDITHTHQTLQHVGDPVAMLRDMARVTAPGGTIAAREVDYSATTWFPRLDGLDLWLDVYGRVHRAMGSEPDAARHLRAWALGAGLVEPQFSATAWVFTEPDDRAWWGGSWAQRAMESDFARHALDGRHASRDELTLISAAWTQWAAHEHGWLSMTHGELLARPPAR